MNDGEPVADREISGVWLKPWERYEVISEDGDGHLMLAFDGSMVRLILTDNEGRQTLGFSATDMERIWRTWSEWRATRVRDV